MDVFKTLIHSQPGAVGSTVAITGGSINGTNIGATTPGTGAFTTLTSSSSSSSVSPLQAGNTSSAITSIVGSFLAPSAATFSSVGNGPYLSVGVANSANNAAVVQHLYTAAGSANNQIQLGTFGSAQPLSVDGNGNTVIRSTTDSTSTTTGALIVSGGLGVAKKSNFGDQLTISHASSAVGLASTTNADSTAYWAFTPQSGTGRSFSVGVGGPGSTVDGGALANKFFVRNNSTGGYSMLIDGTSNATTLAGSLIIPTSTPASAAASGTAGTIAWDSSYIYVCTAANTWKRVAIATW